MNSIRPFLFLIPIRAASDFPNCFIMNMPICFRRQEPDRKMSLRLRLPVMRRADTGSGQNGQRDCAENCGSAYWGLLKNAHTLKGTRHLRRCAANQNAQRICNTPRDLILARLASNHEDDRAGERRVQPPQPHP